MAEDWRNKKIVVIGAGKTGLAATSHLLRRGAAVVLSDRRSRDRIAGLETLPEGNLQLDLGNHTLDLFRQADLVVVSPGIALTEAPLVAAKEAGVRIIGEIELAAGGLAAPLVAVTGTNGKSTTTTLLGEIFQAWGKRTFVGGNLGTPLIEAVDGGPWDWLVAEISSFQLEAVETFHPRYALLLNVTEDHLDRYPDMSAYLAAKAEIFRKQGPGDVMILNAEDPLVLDCAADGRASRVTFSSRAVPEEGMGFDGKNIIWRDGRREKAFPVDQLQLEGVHNVENVMAALVPPLLEGCPEEVAWRAVCGFRGLEHRMTAVRTLNGVTWYDDSKGTNVGSVVRSLEGLPGPVTLIAGGKDKGGDFGLLADAVREKVAHLLLLGEAAGRIASVLGPLTHTVRVDSMGEAVRTARELTPAGGAVLLSPGCSSFDMFTDYRERGEIFSRAVMELPERKAV